MMEWVRRIFPTAILLPREYYGGVLQPQMQKLCIMSKSTVTVKNRRCAYFSFAKHDQPLGKIWGF